MKLNNSSTCHGHNGSGRHRQDVLALDTGALDAGSWAVTRYAKYVGRVGALAVALGIGIAFSDVVNVAHADNAGKGSSVSSSGGSGSSGSPGSASSPAPKSASSEQADASTATNSSPSNAQKSRGSGHSSTSSSRSGVKDTHSTSTTADGAATTGGATDASGEQSGGAQDSSTTAEGSGPGTPAFGHGKRQDASSASSADFRSGSSVTARKPTGKSSSTTTATSSSSTTTTSSVAPQTAVSANVSPRATSAVAQLSVSTNVVAVQTVPAVLSTPAAGTAPSNTVTSIASTLLTWAGLSPAASGTPSKPALPVGIWAVLAWARREIQNTFFASTPTINYNAAQNSQTFDGVITGNLNATDANGYNLTYTVTKAPANGTVTVNPDGTFTYTPTDALAFTGGSDTFTVSVDDRPGNPWHLHGLATFFAPNGGATATEAIAVAVKPTSPLGTPDQLALEKLATQVANSPQMLAAEAQLKTAWLGYAQAFYSQSGGPDAQNLAQMDAALKEYAMAAAYQVVNNDPTRPEVLTLLTGPHDWYGSDTAGGRYAYDNPDTIYRTIPVNASSSYVITGKYLGGVPIDGNFGVYADISASQPVGNLPASALVVNPDGTFTITVDSSASTPGQTNHIQLPANAQQLFIRYTISDWATQSAPELTVVRTSGPAPGTPLTVDQLSTQAAALMTTTGTGIWKTALSLTTVNLQTGQPKPPNTITQPFNFPGTLVTQKQSLGYFDLTSNQALVITINPGSAGYFVVPVTNDWQISPDYWDQQTSLNNSQAVANPDGTYTLVLSPTDPGVTNWISTGGLNQGTLFIRYQDIGDQTDLPTISSQVVSLDQLGTVLPGTTEYLTPAEREAQLAARLAAYDNRYAPYPQGA